MHCYEGIALSQTEADIENATGHDLRGKKLKLFREKVHRKLHQFSIVERTKFAEDMADMA